MEDNHCIVSAANIYFGAFFEYDSMRDQESQDNPESLLIAKNLLQTMSKEAKDAIRIILNAPNEMFFRDGRIKKDYLRDALRKKHHYTWKVISNAENELKEFLTKA